MRFAVIALGMIGCYAPSIPSGGACTSTCPGEQVCIANVCRAPGTAPEIDAPIVDSDGDGQFDDRDNCIAHANGDQHDEDLDGAGDVCDPCPHLASTPPLADGDEDGVGDACDPQPARKAQQWVLFDPFVGEKRSVWSSSMAATFANDRLTLADGYIRLTVATGELRIAVGGALGAFGPVPRQHSLALGTAVDGSYYYAEAYQDVGNGNVKLTKFTGTVYASIIAAGFGGDIPAGAFSWVIDQSVAAQTIALDARHLGTAYPLQAETIAPNLEATSSLLFGAQSMTATYDYVAIIRTLP